MRLSRATTVEKFKALGVRLIDHAAELAAGARYLANTQAYNEESLEFLAQLIGRSGIGDATALPEGDVSTRGLAMLAAADK